MPKERRWSRNARVHPSTWSLRLRLTVVASLVTAGVLVATSIALVLLFQRSLTASADDLARNRATDLVELARRGALPQTITSISEDGVAQVVDAGGHVVAASANVEGAPPLTRERPTDDEALLLMLEDAPDDDETEDYRVWAVRGATDDGDVVAYVGNSEEAVAESVATLVGSLAVAVPVVLVLLTGLVWVLVGRTLQPVEQAHARQRAFVADASHELQSPLTSFRTQLEVALQHPDGLDWPHVARDLLEDSDRMERLVRDLLFLARQDEPAAPVDMLVDLDDVVLEEVARVRSRSSVRLDTGGVSAAPVRGRRDDLARVVRNLLDNAVRHARSSVTVDTRTDASTVLLTVADDGPGIAPEERPHVFDRFYRGDAARDHGGSSTGLGLAIVSAVVTRHGGSVEVVDSDTGAALVVRLPVG